jgi:predicted amidohydrolase
MHVEYDKSKNIEKHLSFIKEAAEEDVRLLVFPECALQGYTWSWDAEKGKYLHDEAQQAYFEEVSEPIPGPSTNLLAQYAERHNMFLQIGMSEKTEKQGRSEFYNSVALIGPHGLLGVYRKIHMAPNPVFVEGDQFLVFNTDLGVIGPIICADLGYPESVRVLALKGAEIVTMSTAWGMIGGRPGTDLKDKSCSYPGYYSGYRYDILTRASALENGVWMIVADQVGSPQMAEEKCFGHSRIVDPSGRIISGIGYEEGLVIGKIDIKAGIRVNRFRGRRPNCYRTILEGQS